ncbi:MAG TPA: DMT family transporter [Terriglobia bacterium]|nr:DMT family transporter [Terriglobia bacterium]
MHPARLASLLMIIGTFCWASNIVAVKWGLQGFNAQALAELRICGAAILFSIICFLQNGLPTLHLGRRQWFTLALMAFCGITLNQIFYIGGIANTSVTHAGLVQAVQPIMVMLLAAALGMEIISSRKWAAMVLAFAGVGTLLIGGPPQASAALWTGDMMLLGASGVFAYYTILMKDAATTYNNVTLNALIFWLGAILLLPFCARSVLEIRWTHVPAQAWWGLAYMVLFGSFVAYLIYAYALQQLAASKVAAFSYLQPLMAVALGVWLMSEQLTIKIIAGGTLILVGVYLAQLDHHYKKYRSRGETHFSNAGSRRDEVWLELYKVLIPSHHSPR